MAVNETEVPEQLGLLPLLCRIDTAGVSDGFTVMMMAFDVAGFGAAQVAVDVITQVTVCPFVRAVVV